MNAQFAFNVIVGHICKQQYTPYGRHEEINYISNPSKGRNFGV